MDQVLRIQAITMRRFLIIVFALLSAGIMAQRLPTTPNPPTAAHYTEFTAGTESIDSVTVGSRMPYKVEAQTPITGLTFEYKWLFSPALTVQTLTGGALTASTLGGTDYYSANEISVVMPATAGDITVTTNVRSIFRGIARCTGDDISQTIRVLPRPTVKWAAGGYSFGCLQHSVTIPLTLTGNAQYEVAYTINYYSGYESSGTLTSTQSGFSALTSSDLVFPAGTFAGGDGLYEIRITGITDRISRKSLDMTLVASVAADLPDDIFEVFIYPAPVTNPLQHIKNMQ